MLAHVLSRIVRGSEIGRASLQIASHLPILNNMNPLDKLTLIEHVEWASRYRLAGRHPAIVYGHGFAARAVESCSWDVRSGPPPPGYRRSVWSQPR